MKKVGKVSYKVQLSYKLKIYLFFHVSLLKPYHEDMEDMTYEGLIRASIIIVTSFENEVECMLAERKIRG